MILVAGESLIDLIVGPDDGVNASPGGGPFNAARTIARLGQPTRFLGRFSADPFGQLLAGKLAEDGVELAVPGWIPEPTALAIVALGARGVPEYWFHLAQTAGFVLDQPTAQQALQADVTALHIGSLGLVVEPMAAELSAWWTGSRQTCCYCSTPTGGPRPSRTRTSTGPGSGASCPGPTS